MTVYSVGSAAMSTNPVPVLAIQPSNQPNANGSTASDSVNSNHGRYIDARTFATSQSSTNEADSSNVRLWLGLLTAAAASIPLSGLLFLAVANARANKKYKNLDESLKLPQEADNAAKTWYNDFGQFVKQLGEMPEDEFTEKNRAAIENALSADHLKVMHRIAYMTRKGILSKRIHSDFLEKAKGLDAKDINFPNYAEEIERIKRMPEGERIEFFNQILGKENPSLDRDMEFEWYKRFYERDVTPEFDQRIRTIAGK